MEEVKTKGLTFKDAKLLADVSYQDVKNGFIGFGYYLRAIRDGALWKDSGYGSFNEFLDTEYGRDKSWASRCINLYDKFGVPVEPGELPRLGEQYEAYNVSQLIEMIPMQEELREQVTPDMPVKAIRALKPKKEKKVATVATPEPKKEEPDSESGCPPGIQDCQRQEWGTSPEEQAAGHNECKKCWAAWKRGQKMLSAAEVQQEVEDAAEVQQEGPGIPSQEECILDFYQNHMSRQCAQAVKDGNVKMLRQELIINHGETHNGGSTGYGFYNCNPERIHFQDNMCETFLSLTWGKYVKELLGLIGNDGDGASEPEGEVPETVSEPEEAVSDNQENIIDAEFTEIPEPEELTPGYFLEEQKAKLDRLLAAANGVELKPMDTKVLERQKTIVCALEAMVCGLEATEQQKVGRPVQPELPKLKNNDQRKAWVKDYKSWGMWYRDENIDVNYYRYVFDNGTRLIVEEHPEREVYWADERRDEVYYHLVEKGKTKYGGRGTYDEKYCHSASSESEIVEYLKKIQKIG